MPILFFMGNQRLFYRDGVGSVWFAKVSKGVPTGPTMRGMAVSERGLTVVSDTRKQCRYRDPPVALKLVVIVIVLLEGFDHFRIKRTRFR